MFGPEQTWPAQDLIAFSDEVDADLVVAAYRSGVFPMPLLDADFEPAMGWWSPMRRAIIPLDRLRVTRSMRQSARRYRTSVDQAFDMVLERCADPRRPGGWIDDDIKTIYGQLHRAGVVHSVETWDHAGRLVGGLYGVSIGGLFAGESMFHDELQGRDASKVALGELVRILSCSPTALLDVQWCTDHLASLGAIEVSRKRYLQLLSSALELEAPDWKAARLASPPHRWNDSARRGSDA